MEKFVKITLKLMMVPIIGLIVSCAGEPDCSLINRASLYGNFYTYNDNGMVVRGALQSLTIRAIKEEGKDTILLNSMQNVQNIDIPLQYNADTTAIVFQYNELAYDTIIFEHTNSPYFVSMECGYEMKQAVTNLRYTEHGIDSIILRDINTNKDGTENLRIFFTSDAE